MVQRIQVGNEIVEFPDGMSDADISNALKTSYKPQETTPKYDLGPVLTGAKQVVRDTLTAGAGSLPQRIVKGAIVNPLLGTLQLTGSPGVKELAQEVDTATQKGRAEQGSTGFDWAEFIGSLGNPQNFLVPLKGASTLGTVGRGAGAGAVAGATQPVLDEDFAAEKLKQVLFGAGAGGALTAGGAALGKMKDFLSEAIKPFREAGRDSILLAKLKEIIPADKWEAVKNALNIAGTEDKVRAAQGLPTAKQSAAEATSGIPEATGLAAWEKVISKIPGLSGKFNAFREAGEQARYENIASLGGSKANISAAEAAREEAANVLYGEANKARLPGRETNFVRQQVGETSAVPEIDAATGLPRTTVTGRNTLTNEPIVEQSVTRGGQPVYTQVAAGYKYDPALSGLIQRPAIKSAIEDAATIAENKNIQMFDQSGKLTGEGAHLIKLSLDDAATGNATTAVGKNAKNAIISAKEDYLKWVESNVPAYKAARETYAAMSNPINRMKVGEQLEAALKTPLDRERAGAFANAVTESATLLKKATGQNRFKNLDEILTPDEMKRVDYVLENLVKKEAARKSGAATTIDANMIGKEGHQLPQFLSATATVANTVLRLVRKDANARITNKFGELLMNPQELARFMDGVPAQDANAVVKALNVALPPQYRNALASRLKVTGPAAVYEQESRPLDTTRGSIVQDRQSVFPQNRQQGMFNQPMSKTEAVNVIAQAAQQYGKPQLTGLLTGIAKVESNFDPNAKAKGSTAAGMFQFTKATQKDYGLTNPHDAAASAGAAAAYIDKLIQRYKGDEFRAIAAYNQGPGVIDKGMNKAGREYAMKVMAARRNI